MSGKITCVEMKIWFDDGGQRREVFHVPFGTNLRDQAAFREVVRGLGELALDAIVDYGYLP